MSRRSGVGEEAQLAVALLLVRAERPRAPGHLARLCIHVAARRPSPSRRDRYARGQRAGHPGLPAGRPRRGPGSRAAYAPCYAPDEAYRDRALFLGQLWAILTTPDHSWGNHLPLKSPDLWRSTAFRGRGAFGGRRLGFGLKSLCIRLVQTIRLQPVSSPSPRCLRASVPLGDSWVAGTAQNPCLGARSPTAAVGWGF
jgi:hypothetical protein